MEQMVHGQGQWQGSLTFSLPLCQAVVTNSDAFIKPLLVEAVPVPARLPGLGFREVGRRSKRFSPGSNRGNPAPPPPKNSLQLSQRGQIGEDAC